MRQYLDKAFTYGELIAHIDSLLIEGKTTGPNQSEQMVDFTKLNRKRMDRITKTVTLDSDIVTSVKLNARPQIWLVLTEGWCGDAAQNLPLIEKIAGQTDIIETQYILRDENLELMDQFLTNGGRAIPKLIALDKETLEILGTWGARPATAQKLFEDLKAQDMPKPLIMENLQRWYNNDQGRSLMSEFAILIDKWGGRKTAAANV